MNIEVNTPVNVNGEQQLVYQTKGTCSKFIEVGMKEGKISKCQFYGGCDGNTKGLAQLVVGMTPDEVKKRLDGIRCGMKSTSCPDQLCRALDMLEAQK